MKTVIVDDEQLGIDSLQWELKRLDSDIQIVKTFTDPIEAYAYLQHANIDLLFSDIQMPLLNGLELLKKLDPINFQVVFVTAFDEYALQALKFSALDYLLKPVDKLELTKALEKFNAVGLDAQQASFNERIHIQQSAATGDLPDKVVFATKETFEFIKPSDIMYCEALSNYTAIYTTSNKLVVSKTLKEVEELLMHYNFLRVHRSFLVNPTFIKRYVKTLGGSLIMENDLEISISKTRKDAVMEILKLK